MTGVGWGVAGCGWVARDHALPALRARPPVRGMMALHDRDPGGAGPGARPRSRHADLAAFLATPGLDAVYVAVPERRPPARWSRPPPQPATRCCARSRWPPTWPTPRRGTGGAAPAPASCSATAFDQRWHPAHCGCASWWASWAPGHRRADRLLLLAAGGLVARRPPARQLAGRPARAGGGAAIDLAPHGLDLAGVLLGEDVAELTATLQRGCTTTRWTTARCCAAGPPAACWSACTWPTTARTRYPRRRLEVVGTRGDGASPSTRWARPPAALLHLPAPPRAGRHPVRRHRALHRAVRRVQRRGHRHGAVALPRRAGPRLHRLLLEALDARHRPMAEPSREQSRATNPYRGLLPDLPAFACTNCGHWQRWPAPGPQVCPVCADVRNALPAARLRVRHPPQADELVTGVLAADGRRRGDRVRRPNPGFGLGGAGGWVVETDAAWSASSAPPGTPPRCSPSFAGWGAAWRAGVRHVHGSARSGSCSWSWSRRLVCVGVRDLEWTKAFRVTWPADDVLELAPGPHAAPHRRALPRPLACCTTPRAGSLFCGESSRWSWIAGGPVGLRATRPSTRRFRCPTASCASTCAVRRRLAFETSSPPFELVPGVTPDHAWACSQRLLAGHAGRASRPAGGAVSGLPRSTEAPAHRAVPGGGC